MRAFLRVPRKAALLAVFVTLSMFSLVRRADAQEVRIPFDASGRVERLDLEMARAADLFVAEFPGFISAELFQRPDSVIVLEIRRGQAGRTLRTVRPVSASELAMFRERVGRVLAVGTRPGRDESQDGNARVALLGGSTALGLGLYGWALPDGLGIDDSRWRTGLYMLTASGSFIVPWLLTEDPVAPAAAELAFYGGSRGFGHGYLLHDLVLGRQDRVECDIDLCIVEDDGPGRNLSGSVTGIAEGIGGYALAEALDLSPGHANAITVGGDWGVLMGLGVAQLTNAGDRGVGAAGLGGTALGLWLGHRFGRSPEYSYGDAEMLATPGWLGLYAGASITDAAGGGNDAVTAAAMALGTAGLVVGNLLVQDRDYTFAQSTLTRLGTVAGGLLGLGTAVILDESVDDMLAASLSTAGAAAGFAITRSLFDAQAVGESALRFQIAPELRPDDARGVRLGLDYRF